MERHRVPLRYTTLILAAALAPAQTLAPADAARPISIRVDANRKASYKIPRTIFGSFLEPIGNSTYNGLWAEVLQNPSFEDGLWSAPAIARMLEQQPELRRASSLGLPLPWEPLDETQGNRYEPRWGDAANSWRSLAVLGLPGKATGIKERVYLPVHRELHYQGSLFVKHLSGPAGLDISLRQRGDSGQVLAHANVTAAAADWQKYTFSLELPPDRLRPLEPADFVIQVEGDERTLVDQASLMPADALEGLDPEMVALSKAMNTPLVRFGGNFTSAYHWRDGVGPRDKRVSMLNIAWGIPEYNQFGTDEFLHFCELIGAEPQVALNLGSGTPEEAADWVRYINEHWKQHNGLLWELGNELWGEWNLGYPTLKELPARTLAFSKAIRQVDPNARLIATGADPDVYQKWNAAQLTDPPGTFDFLSTHFVVTNDRLVRRERNPDAVAEADFALPVELGRRLRAMQQQINQSSAFRDKARIAFTEWLFIGHQGDAPSFTNMGGAVDAGGFFNMLMQNADIVPISDMTGIIEFAGIWKKRGRVYPAPAYYAFQLYSTAAADVPVTVQDDSPTYDVHEGVSRLPEITKVPYLDVVAALNEQGNRLTLFCVNRHATQDLPARISLENFHPKGLARIRQLRSESIYDENSEEEPDLVIPVEESVKVGSNEFRRTFPHESVTRIELSSK